MSLLPSPLDPLLKIPLDRTPHQGRTKCYLKMCTSYEKQVKNNIKNWQKTILYFNYKTGIKFSVNKMITFKNILVQAFIGFI